MPTRQRLRDSWGLCNWHAWTAVDTRAPATGIAILCEDLLRVCHDRIEAARDRHPRQRPGLAARVLSRLRGIVGRPPAPRSRAVTGYNERARCALCAQLRTTEAHCLDAVLHFAADAQFASAYERSAGLCVPHLVAMMERGSGSPGLRTIVEHTLPKWQALRKDLADFVSKHEYRSTTPITDSESRSYHLALELLSGRRSIFGTDMRRD